MQIKKQIELIRRGVLEIISEGELEAKLTKSHEKKVPLKIKAGFDPTAPDIHLGHSLLLRKLRQFQDLGHIVYFLIGDFTARIGDPSGQAKVRKSMSSQEVLENAKTYEKQVFKILDKDRTKVVFNSDWLGKMDGFALGELFTRYTVSRLIERDDFSQRLKLQKPLYISEFIYPLLQGYDSVRLEADVEVGGSDQKFNMIVGRDLQESYNMPPQAIVTLPLLVGLDGKDKMSKSYGNYIGINEPAKEMFGKIMSISDDLMANYYELLTDVDLAEIPKMHPREAKIRLAKIIVAQYHSTAEAEKQASEFNAIFSKKELPADIPQYRSAQGSTILKLLLDSKLAKTGNEARRLIHQGAVSFNNQKITEDDFIIKESGILRAGGRRFLKIIIAD